MNRFFLFVARCAAYFWMWSRAYSVWSKIHRFFFDREARGLELPTAKEPGEIAAILRGMGWRSDSWIDLGDAVCSPQMVWLRFLKPVDSHRSVGDCDEFAIFSASVIKHSIDKGAWDSVAVDPKLLTVMWFDAEGRASGHNVCLVRWQSKDASVSPMREPMFGYMDYDLPMFYGEIERVVNAVRKRYAGPGNVGVGWALHTPDLKFLEAHWG